MTLVFATSHAAANNCSDIRDIAANSDNMNVNPVFERVKSAMLEYYALLSTMPHYASDSLELPPPGGWPDLDVEGLKALGRSDAAIEFVRHLPCLKPCLNCDRAWITELSPAVAYHRGETWPAYLGTAPGMGLWLPPHLFYLSQAVDGKYGTCIILDTERGTIIEESTQGGGPLERDPISQENRLTWDEYEALPVNEKWTTHRTTPAAAFFGLEALRMQRLVSMPVPTLPRNGAEPRWYDRARDADERQILEVEDEWEADHEHDPEYVETDGPSSDDVPLDNYDADSNTDEEFEVVPVDPDELHDLAAELEEAALSDRPWNESSDLKRWHSPPEMPPEVLRVYDCYKRHGWPYVGFDVAACRSELFELDFVFQKERDLAAKKRKHPHFDKWDDISLEAYYERVRQYVKRHSGRHNWDEEKEKSQSAQEWWTEYEQKQR